MNIPRLRPTPILLGLLTGVVAASGLGAIELDATRRWDVPWDPHSLWSGFTLGAAAALAVLGALLSWLRGPFALVAAHGVGALLVHATRAGAAHAYWPAAGLYAAPLALWVVLAALRRAQRFPTGGRAGVAAAALLGVAGLVLWTVPRALLQQGDHAVVRVAQAAPDGEAGDPAFDAAVGLFEVASLSPLTADLVPCRRATAHFLRAGGVAGAVRLDALRDHLSACLAAGCENGIRREGKTVVDHCREWLERVPGSGP